MSDSAFSHVERPVGYPTPGKVKARNLLEAFCGGAGGTVVERIPDRLRPGAAAFYGVTAATRHLWLQARAEGRDWYYLDNAYFDPTREVYFRVARNRLQHRGTGDSTGVRFASLRIGIRPWRAPGRHVLLCPQSDPFMEICAEYPGRWARDTLTALKRVTDRELRVRPWHPDKRAWYRSLPEDLRDCACVVTYSSASAITAMLAGVPAIVTADDAIAAAIAGRDLAQVNDPPRPDNREEFCRVVADNQWTLDEMRSGLAWRMLHASA